MKLLLGYKNNNSFIHRLDPRIKLFWLLGNLALIIFFQNIWLLILCLCLIILTCRLAGISLKDFSMLCKVMFILGIQLIILEGFLYKYGQVIFELGFLKFYLGGALLGLKGILILFNLAFLCLQFMMWTSPEEMTLLLVKFKLPQKYASLVGLALHFLPVMERELKTIYESQESRGMEHTTIMQKIKSLFPIMVPLIMRALKKTDEVAQAMELKGYTLYKERTFLREIAFTKLDYTALTFLTVFYSFIFIVNFI